MASFEVTFTVAARGSLFSSARSPKYCAVPRSWLACSRTFSSPSWAMEVDGGGWRWMEVDGGGWRWMEVDGGGGGRSGFHSHGAPVIHFRHLFREKKSHSLWLKDAKGVKWGFPKMGVPPNGWFMVENT